MKTKLLEKNGFLRPVGLVLIIILLSAFCFTEYLFGQETEKKDQKIVLHMTIPEVVIVHTGFKFPPKMVFNPIEEPINVDQWAAELMYWNKDGYDDLAVLLAKREKVMSEPEKINKIVGSVTVPDNEFVIPESKTKQENSILRSIGKAGIQKDR